MKKIFLFIITGCLGTALHAQSGADSLLNFIVKNKSRTALYMLKNDYEFTKLNENTLMPLAGAANIMVAVEFAKQAAYNVFGFNALVPLREISKFYLPNTDDGAYGSWVTFEKHVGHIKNDSVKLIDVARGMMIQGSTANAEYLMENLGFQNIKNDIRMFGLKQHTLLYPMPASLFIYQNPKKIQEDKLLKEIQGLSEDDYHKSVFSIHRELNMDSGYIEKFRPQDFTIKMQKAWSARLTASTAKEYAKVARVINSRIVLNEKTYAVLGKLIESVMESPTSRTWLKHAGLFGGSTASVFTRVVYATLKDGTKMELAYFFNNLNSKETDKLQSWSLNFESRILKDENFRKRFAAVISGKK